MTVTGTNSELHGTYLIDMTAGYGTLNVNSGGKVYVGSAVTMGNNSNVYIDGGTLQCGGSSLFLNTTGNVQIKNGGVTVDTQGNNVTNQHALANYSGNTGTLTKLGIGTLTLTANNTYTGLTTVSQGTLQLGNSSGSGTVAGNILDNAAVTFSYNASKSYASAISGTGGVTLSNSSLANILTLTGANTYTGNTTITKGTFKLDTPGSMVLDVNDASNTSISVAATNGSLDVFGTFKLDLSDVDLTTGTWNMVTGSGTKTYESSFAVADKNDGGFTSAGGGVWTYTPVSAPTELWTFTQSSGVLTLSTVPEPGTMALLACGLAGLLAYAWKKRK